VGEVPQGRTNFNLTGLLPVEGDNHEVGPGQIGLNAMKLGMKKKKWKIGREGIFLANLEIENRLGNDFRDYASYKK
jgi:hypothetical protein